MQKSLREKSKRISFKVAFCGVMAALGIALMFICTVIPIMTYAGPLLASLLLLAVIYECGRKAALMTYGATAILSILIIADKEAAFFYIAVGYYPIIKPYFDKIKNKLLRVLSKFAFFAVVTGILYVFLIFVMGLEGILESSGSYRYFELGGFVIALALIMVMFDFLYEKYIKLYEKRIHPRLKFLGKLGVFILAAGILIGAKSNDAYAYTKAVTYFGNEWAANFINSEHSQAAEDFKRIRNDGFNTVIFCIPWRELQPNINGAFNDTAIAKIDELMSKAQGAGLKVMFRLGYTWDYGGSDSVLVRYNNVFKDKSYKSSWLSYAQKMYEVGAAHSNFAGGFITWEDFWTSLGGIYSNNFVKMDAQLINLLTDTQAVFPNLSMECRLDEDYQGGSRYSHSSTFGCAGASYTSAMMSASMGWENNRQ